MSAAAAASPSSSSAAPSARILSSERLYLSPSELQSLPKRYDTSPSDWLNPPVHAVQAIFYYPLPQDKQSDPSSFLPVSKLRSALHHLLRSYPILLGELKEVPHETQKGRYEVVGHEVGAQLVLAESDVPMSDVPLSESSYTSTRSLPASLELLPIFDRTKPLQMPIFNVQHTRFACGGVALGFHVSHIIADAESFFTLLTDLSELYEGNTDKLSVPPSLDRSWLLPTAEEKADVERNSAAMLESYYYKPGTIPKSVAEDPKKQSDAPAAAAPPAAVAATPAPSPPMLKVYRYTPEQLERLKQTASVGNTSDSWISTFEALAGHFQHCIYLARNGGTIEGAQAAAKVDASNGKENLLTLSNNFRSRLLKNNPAVPTGKYFGNLFILSTVHWGAEELVNSSLPERARKVHDCIQRTSKPERFKHGMAWVDSQVNCAEIVPHWTPSKDYAITCWHKFGMYDVKFEGVKPIRVTNRHIPGADGLAILFGQPTPNTIDVVLGLTEEVHARLEQVPEFKLFRGL